MPQIYYEPDDRTVSVGGKATILESSLKADINHVHVCGGYARCSTCRVLVLDGLQHCSPRNNAEQNLADRLSFSSNIRLACQTSVDGDVKVRRLVLDEEDIRLTSQLKDEGSSNNFVGQEREVAILFADIRGFTSFAESQLPYDVVHALNRYFFEMGEVITRNGGYIDNYMGDGLMALFGVADNTDAPLRAVKAGYEMTQAMENLKPYLRSVYKTDLEIGVGVHYGTVVVGSIGASNRKKVTAIGDAVNLASRIESANKATGTRMLISEDVYHYVRQHIGVGKESELALKGKTGHYKLYEITQINGDVELAPPTDNPAFEATAGMLPHSNKKPTFTERVLRDLRLWMTVSALVWALVGAGWGIILAAQAESGLMLMPSLINILLGAFGGSVLGFALGSLISLLFESLWTLGEMLLQNNQPQENSKV